jgi:hypothetical protein
VVIVGKGDLAAAIRNRTDIHFGLYHSLFDFYHPLYLKDKASGFKTQKFVEVCTKYTVFITSSGTGWQSNPVVIKCLLNSYDSCRCNRNYI